ncbi:MAG: DUF4160 domain-containing protein [Proteobacteria bacterium]|nr:DUF4160 domain-containing protein [Pseudomonadota bacterium]
MRIYELYGKKGALAFIIEIFGRDHLPEHVHVRSPKGTISGVFELKNGIFVVKKSTVKGFREADISVILAFLNKRKNHILEKWREFNG